MLQKRNPWLSPPNPKGTFAWSKNPDHHSQSNSDKSVDSHKLLGLVLDEQLTWNLHIDEVCSKVLKRINLLKAIKIYLPQCARQSFYKSLIQPIIDYACVIWSATSQYNLDRIIRLQKYATRVILNIKHPQDVPSSELFYELNWMTIRGSGWGCLENTKH